MIFVSCRVICDGSKRSKCLLYCIVLYCIVLYCSVRERKERCADQLLFLKKCTSHRCEEPQIYNMPTDVVVVVFTLKTVLTSIQSLLFLTLQGKETNFRGHTLTQNKVQENKIK